MCVSVCMHMCEYRCLWISEEGINSVFELPVVVNHLMWVLGIKLRSLWKRSKCVITESLLQLSPQLLVLPGSKLIFGEDSNIQSSVHGAAMQKYRHLVIAL